MQFSGIFTPIKIGNMEVANRLVAPAMGTNHPTPDGTDFTISDSLIQFWATRAKGGWGMVITEVVAVDPLGKVIPNEPGLYDDKQIPLFKKWADAMHENNGAKIVLQLHHAGRVTSSRIIGTQPVAPSQVACPVSKIIPRELSIDEVWELIEKYGDAARRAREAGFDAVEVHGGHGYLVAQFMSGYSNKRTDIFGGSFKNLMRMPVEVVKNIKKKAGNDFPVLFRISADELVPGGRTVRESAVAARMLEEAGIDAINVSCGVYESFRYMVAPSSFAPGYILPHAQEIKKSVTIPVIGVNRVYDPYVAEDAIQTGMADMIAMARGSLADPQLPNKLKAGEVDDIAPCIACMVGCGQTLYGRTTTCLVNPFCGRETEMMLKPAARKKNVVVVGGGPAGLETAWVAAACGHNVTLYEKEAFLGGQFKIGAVPPFKHELSKAIRWWTHMGEKHGVQFKMQTEATAEQILAEKPDAVILCTGGKPKLPPGVKGTPGPKFANAADYLSGKVDIGKNVLIVGGSETGCETADLLGQTGYKVTIMEMLPDIGSGIFPSSRHFLMERLHKYGVNVITGIACKEFLEDGVVGEKDGAETRLTGFDSVLLCTGVQSVNPLEKKLKDKVPELYVLGDAANPKSALEAVEEGARIGLKL